MSEQQVEPVENEVPEPEQGDPAEFKSEGSKQAVLTDLSSERDRRRAAEKANADLSAQLKAIETANMSDLERAQTAAKTAQEQVTALTLQNLVSQVAITKGVPADLVGFLTGETEDDIAAKADVLMARLNAPTTPKPDATQGAAGTPASGSTADMFAAAIESSFN